MSNYQKVLGQLSKFIQHTSLNEPEEQGLIQSFEYTHELAWKTLSDFIKSKGNTELFGSKDATREAFKLNLIDNGESHPMRLLPRFCCIRKEINGVV